MNAGASTVSEIDMQEAHEEQPIPEDRNSDSRNKESPNADKNETGHGEINLKLLKRKTEFCGTHTLKIQEKCDSTKNNAGFGQEKDNVLLKNPQMDSNNYKNIKDFQPDSSKDDRNDEKETAFKVVNDSIEEVSSGKDIVHSPKNAPKNTDITSDKSMSVSLKENSICKGTVSSQGVSNNKMKSVPNEDCTAANVFDAVPTDANPIPEKSVLTNEASPAKVCQTLTAARTNPFDEKPMIPKSSMTSIPHSSNSEPFTEMKPLAPTQPIKANQSIYKLAFNESLTSSENSRSLSPLDPETQIPSSFYNDEIIVHEAGTDSDAGSEDVELIAHRYECETSLNKNKNVYVNKLSLAVELLRTQESLPYDSNFKRVVEDNDPAEDQVGEVNFGFEEDSTFFNSSNQRREVVVTSPSKSNVLPISGGRQCTSGASSIVVDEIEFNDSCEGGFMATPVKERDATKEVKAANRRYKVQLRHYFTPSATNPCLCCVVM